MWLYLFGVSALLSSMALFQISPTAENIVWAVGPSAGEILKMLMYMWAEVAQTGLKYLCCIPPKSNNLQNRSLLCAGKCLKALRLGFLGPWNPCIVGTIVMPLIIIMSIVSNAAS